MEITEYTHVVRKSWAISHSRPDRFIGQTGNPNRLAGATGLHLLGILPTRQMY
jgi:hypothetical protein